jgi:hypothetical protein
MERKLVDVWNVMFQKDLEQRIRLLHILCLVMLVTLLPLGPLITQRSRGNIRVLHVMRRIQKRLDNIHQQIWLIQLKKCIVIIAILLALGINSLITNLLKF